MKKHTNKEMAEIIGHYYRVMHLDQIQGVAGSTLPFSSEEDGENAYTVIFCQDYINQLVAAKPGIEGITAWVRAQSEAAKDICIPDVLGEVCARYRYCYETDSWQELVA